jgi:hypothetical protein
MATNAAYCKTYRKRIYNFDGHVQQTATPIPPAQHDSYVDVDADADAEIMDNEVNDFFDEMNDINGNQIEEDFFINNDGSISSENGNSDSDSDLYCSTDNDYDDANIRFHPNGSITLHQAYTAIKTFIIKCNLTYTHILHLISLLYFLLPFGHQLTKLGVLRWYNKREEFTYTTLCIKCNHQVNIQLIIFLYKRLSYANTVNEYTGFSYKICFYLGKSC